MSQKRLTKRLHMGIVSRWQHCGSTKAKLKLEGIFRLFFVSIEYRSLVARLLGHPVYQPLAGTR